MSYLDSLEGQLTIIYEPENKGPRNFLLNENFYRLLPEYFCLTDPDLEFSTKLPSDFVLQLVSLTETYSVGKAGFSLDISEPQSFKEEDFLIGERKYKIWEWEEQFWRDRLPSDLAGNAIYRASIDTTFAVYNKKYFKRETFMDAIRVAGSFTCRHLPWYKDSRLPGEEEAYYRKSNKFSYYFRCEHDPEAPV